MPQYRIVKKYFRSDRTGGILTYYNIQSLEISFLKALFGFKNHTYWKDYRISRYNGYDFTSERLDFDEKYKAKEYLDELIKPLPNEEIID
jgi:hypothetical protein